MRTFVAAAALALVAGASGACKKDSTAIEWESADRSEDAVESNREAASDLEAPAMFAHIPADTAFVFASFDPFPDHMWKQMSDTMGPAVKDAFDDFQQMGAAAGDPDFELFNTVFEMIGDLMTAEGFEKAGFSTEPRMALYGLGPMPVMRLEIEDGGKLRGYIQKKLDEVNRVGAGDLLEEVPGSGFRYWRSAPDLPRSIAIGVTDDELVAVYGPAAAIEAAAPLIFGDETPKASMADGAALKKVAEDYGISAYGVGYVDTQRLAEVFTGAADGVHGAVAAAYPEAATRATPACRQAVGSAALQMPRIVFGYEEVTKKVTSMVAVVETSKAIAKEIEAMRSDVPGLTNRFPTDPLVAFGLGVELGKAEKMMTGLEEDFEAVERECSELSDDIYDDPYDIDDYDYDDDFGSLDGLGMLGGGTDDMGGMVVVVQDAKVTDDGIEGVDAWAILTMDDPAGMLQGLSMLAPSLGDVKADGDFHRVPLGGFEEYTGKLFIAADKGTLLVALGDKSKGRVKKAMKENGASPLFIVAYDAGRFAELQKKLMESVSSGLGGMGLGPDPMDGVAGIYDAEAQLFGQFVLSAVPTSKGLMIYSRMHMK